MSSNKHNARGAGGRDESCVVGWVGLCSVANDVPFMICKCISLLERQGTMAKSLARAIDIVSVITYVCCFRVDLSYGVELLYSLGYCLL